MGIKQSQDPKNSPAPGHRSLVFKISRSVTAQCVISERTNDEWGTLKK